MDEVVRYTYRVRLSRQAEARLLEEWDRCRWVWNNCVGRDIELRAEGGRTPSGYDLCAELTDWRGRKEWLASGAQNPQANTVLSWAKNRSHAFRVKGRRPPKFKSASRALPTLEYTARGFSIKDGRLVLAGGISIPVVWHRELPSVPKSVTVFRDSLGHWYASFVVRREVEKMPATGRSIGIDWGVSQTATTTNPAYDLPHSKHGRRAAVALAKAQRKVARRRKPRGHARTAGYKAACHETARLYQQVANRRKHDARQWARRVAADHDLIAIEDFKPKFLAKSTMAKAAADAAISATKRELEAYGRRFERDVRLVNPRGTTQTCAKCGRVRTKPLALGERVFNCEFCDNVADRDLNSSQVVLKRALLGGVETYPGSADGVRQDATTWPTASRATKPRL